MMSIESLLNPCRPSPETDGERSGICSSVCSSQTSPLLATFEKLNTPNNLTRFAESKTKGEVRYEPCEIRDEEIAAQHRRFQIYPMCGITKYCKSIPYSSEKKGFLEKTGRDGFEVFRYIFKVPDDDTEHVVMWDYNIGLVRVTPFFKSLRHNKTSPGQMLKKNPGLSDLSHNITGGSIYAQGYWLPFEAAKSVAATFCYNIRYALTPIFGLEFLSMCLLPTHTSFGQMSIDPAIVRQCNETAEQYLVLYRRESQEVIPKTPPPSSKVVRPKSARNQRRDHGTTTKTNPLGDSASTAASKNTGSSHSRNSSYGGDGSPTSRNVKRTSISKAVIKENSEDHRDDEADLNTNDIVETSSSEEIETPPTRRRRKSTTSQSEDVAAQMLMLLGREDAAWGRGQGSAGGGGSSIE